jgi:hypothetical protein
VLGGSEVELFTFELKTEGSGNVAAVHEADAQTRGSHYGYLVWHVPDRGRVEARLAAVERECQRTGVGLILFTSLQRYLEARFWRATICSPRRPGYLCWNVTLSCRAPPPSPSGGLNFPTMPTGR